MPARRMTTSFNLGSAVSPVFRFKRETQSAAAVLTQNAPQTAQLSKLKTLLKRRRLKGVLGLMNGAV
jgi:hypothetical protein